MLQAVHYSFGFAMIFVALAFLIIVGPHVETLSAREKWGSCLLLAFLLLKGGWRIYCGWKLRK